MRGFSCEAEQVWQSFCSTLEQDRAWRSPTGSGQHFCHQPDGCRVWLTSRHTGPILTPSVHTHKRGAATVTRWHVLWSCRGDNGHLIKEPGAHSSRLDLRACRTHINSHRCGWGQKDIRWWCWSSQWHRGSGSESGGSARREWWPSLRTRRVRRLKLLPWWLRPDPLKIVTTSGDGKERQEETSGKQILDDWFNWALMLPDRKLGHLRQ